MAFLHGLLQELGVRVALSKLSELVSQQCFPARKLQLWCPSDVPMVVPSLEVTAVVPQWCPRGDSQPESYRCGAPVMSLS